MKKAFLFLFVVLFLVMLGSNVAPSASETNNENTIMLNDIISRYVDESLTYTKETKIFLNESASNELLVNGGFHADADILERTTYYKGSELWMSRDDNQYSYYGTAEGNTGVTYASVDTPLVTPTDAKVVLSGEGKNSMNEYYVGLEDIIAKDSHNWTYANGVYTTTSEEVIEWFKAFTAPCYLGFTTKEVKNYITLDKATISVDSAKNLILSLYATQDYGKFTSQNGLFSQATIECTLESVWSSETLSNKVSLNKGTEVLLDFYATKTSEGVYVRGDYLTVSPDKEGGWWEQDNIELRFNTPEGKIPSDHGEQWIISTNGECNFTKFSVSEAVKVDEQYYLIEFRAFITYEKLGINESTPLGFSVGINPGASGFIGNKGWNSALITDVLKITEKGISDYCLEETCPHKLGEYHVVKQPTCSEDGLKEAHCLYCNKVDSIAIEATGEHVYDMSTVTVVTPSTCSNNGVGTGKCGCGHIGEVQLELDPTNHGTHWNSETNTCACGSLVNNVTANMTNGENFHYVQYNMDGAEDFEITAIINSKHSGESWDKGFVAEIFSQGWLNGGWSFRSDWWGWGTWTDGGKATYTNADNGVWLGKFNEASADMDILYTVKYDASAGTLTVTMSYHSNVYPYSTEDKQVTYKVVGITYKGSMNVGFGARFGEATFKNIKVVSGRMIPTLDGEMNDAVWQGVENNMITLTGSKGSLDFYYVRDNYGIYFYGYYRVLANVAPSGGGWWQNHNFELKLLTANGYLENQPGNTQWLASSTGDYRADGIYFGQPIPDGEYNVYKIEMYISYGRLGITKDTEVGLALGMNICGQEWIANTNFNAINFLNLPKIPLN